MKRTLTIEATRKVGEKIKVKGWVNSIRSHGKIVFIDLRDRKGILQAVFSSEGEELKRVKEITPESVVEIRGKVKKRPEDKVNLDLETGDIELSAEEIKVISESEPVPIPLDTNGYKIDEKKRLDYRYLDLRRERMQRNLRLRHKVIQFMRKFLSKRDFVEVETPILTKSTPEGARDFIVPSRLQPGKFYALPQSPQQYKQLLMVAGIEKYFQIARCFRDEDPRADRAYGEFTQLDIEMSFTSREEILKLVEELYIKIVRKFFPEKEIKEISFPRISYEEAMEKYGTDKPDIRSDKSNEELAFCFIVDWPLFEKTEEREISPMHHPFTAPKEEDIPLLEEDPMQARSLQYDFVLNGYEIGGGSIRVTDPEVQKKIFKALGHSKEEIEEKFGHLLEAFKYGVPPHGGIAPGIDRSLMVILGEPSVREVMAFPHSSSGRTAVMDAPSEVSEEKLKELGLKVGKED